MLLFDFKENIIEFNNLNLKGSFLKLVGTKAEADQAYDKLSQSNHIITVTIGEILEYTLENFCDLSQGKDAAPSGGRKDRMNMSLLPTKELFVSAGELQSDIPETISEMVALGIREAQKQGLPGTTPVLIQCTTVQGIETLTDLAGEPVSCLLFSEMVNLDAIPEFEEESIVRESTAHQQVASYTLPMQHILLSPQFSIMTPRAVRQVNNLGKIVLGEYISQEEMNDAISFLNDLNLMLKKGGKELLFPDELMVRMGNPNPFAIFNGTGYRAVIADENPWTWSAFQDLFPKDRKISRQALCIGAVDENNQCVGAMAVLPEPAFYTIEWLYVEPEMRRRGIATFLINEFFNYVMTTGSFREIEAHIFEEQEDLEGFFSSLDCFDLSEDGEELTVDADEILNNGILRHLAAETMDRSRFTAFSNVRSYQQKEFFACIKESRFYQVIDEEQWMNDLVKDLSFCSVKDDRVSSAVLFHFANKNTIELSCLYSENQSDANQLLGIAFLLFAKKYPNYHLKALLVNDNFIQLWHEVFGETDKIRSRMLVSWNYE